MKDDEVSPNCFIVTTSFLFLVVRPGAPSSVLAPFVAMPGAPSSFLFLDFFHSKSHTLLMEFLCALRLKDITRAERRGDFDENELIQSSIFEVFGVLVHCAQAGFVGFRVTDPERLRFFTSPDPNHLRRSLVCGIGSHTICSRHSWEGTVTTKR